MYREHEELSGSFSFKKNNVLKYILKFCSLYWRLNDVRRRPKPLYVAACGQMTGVNFSAAMLRDGRVVPAERQVWPWIIAATEAKPAEGDDLAEQEAMAADFMNAFGVAGSDEIGLKDREVMGWACSYRASCPEKRSFKDWRCRWTRARARWSKIPLQAPRLRRPQAEQLVLQETWAKRRKPRKLAAAET